MTANPLEAAIRRVLNDQADVWMPQELVNKEKWSEFLVKLYDGMIRLWLSRS